METTEQKSKWQQLLINIVVGVVVVFLTFMLAKIDKRIEKRMADFKVSQTELISLQMEMIEQQKYTQAYLGIDYLSTEFALYTMFDGEYQEIKNEKKTELIKEYEFKNKSRGD